MKIDKRPILLVFGTSADPIHQGHIHLVEGAVRALQARGRQVAEVMLILVMIAGLILAMQYSFLLFAPRRSQSLPLVFTTARS